ncbi:hypothetical protein ACFV1L_16175 [Kitasatospora sp. NPDC059646]|uniref:hypothetical protein n=1 Tax=Kitasatospora sp. NPDC059646 TaxID=3346893 RepID=UPI0036757002
MVTVPNGGVAPGAYGVLLVSAVYGGVPAGAPGWWAPARGAPNTGVPGVCGPGTVGPAPGVPEAWPAGAGPVGVPYGGVG